MTSTIFKFSHQDYFIWKNYTYVMLQTILLEKFSKIHNVWSFSVINEALCPYIGIVSGVLYQEPMGRELIEICYCANIVWELLKWSKEHITWFGLQKNCLLIIQFFYWFNSSRDRKSRKPKFYNNSQSSRGNFCLFPKSWTSDNSNWDWEMYLTA